MFLVLDGLDQAQFDLKDEPAHEDHNQRLNVSTIIACLFNKTFLPQVQIIVTSRPHALNPLHHSLRPNNIYELQGLSQDDTATLLRCFAGDQFEALWNQLNRMGPKLKDLCRSPLILQMFYLSQIKPLETIGEATTLTRIFATVLENFQHSKHNRAEFQKVQEKLARLAHNTFIKNQITITWVDVKKESLDESEIHDLIIVIPGYKGIYIYKTQCASVCLSAIEIKLETFRYKQTYESYITFSREAKYGILISIRIVFGGLRAYIYSTVAKCATNSCHKITS